MARTRLRHRATSRSDRYSDVKLKPIRCLISVAGLLMDQEGFVVNKQIQPPRHDPHTLLPQEVLAEVWHVWTSSLLVAPC